MEADIAAQRTVFGLHACDDVPRAAQRIAGVAAHTGAQHHDKGQRRHGRRHQPLQNGADGGAAKALHIVVHAAPPIFVRQRQKVPAPGEEPQQFTHISRRPGGQVGFGHAVNVVA